ncbi:MAG: hypothetical protein AAFW74_05510, partial [Pseudomonadota bacterium]
MHAGSCLLKTEDGSGSFGNFRAVDDMIVGQQDIGRNQEPGATPGAGSAQIVDPRGLNLADSAPAFGPLTEKPKRHGVVFHNLRFGDRQPADGLLGALKSVGKFLQVAKAEVFGINTPVYFGFNVEAR